MPERHPVVVIGGGPVGMGLAVDLALRGVECVVVERHVRPQRIPKGQNLTQRTMEHFAFWGVEDQIREARKMPPGYPDSGVTAYRNLMGEYSYPWWRRSAVSDYYARANARIPQYETERVLRERAAALDVTTLHGWSAERLADGHSVRIVNLESARESELEGEYVVGTDGSHSTIREQAGISQDLSDHDRRMVLLVFRSPGLHEVLQRFGEVSFYNIMDPALDGYWRFLGRVDAAGEWFFHAPVPADATTGTYDFQALLHEAVGTEFECEFDYIGFWDLRFAVASRYRSDQVFLAGDAAHSHPPYGGYGINTGFEDARNLAWKLAAALHGWGSEPLLDSYEAERRPVSRSTSADFIERMIADGRHFLTHHDPEVDREDFENAWERRKERSLSGVSDFEPHYEGSPIVFAPGAPGAVGSHHFTARPGHHLGPRGELFDRLGPEFTLLCLGAVSDGFRGAATALGVPLEVIEAPYSGEVTDYGSRLILVRPDHYVSWVGEQADIALARRILGRSAGL